MHFQVFNFSISIVLLQTAKLKRRIRGGKQQMIPLGYG